VPPGTYIVTCNVSDATGTAAEEVTRRVIVEDTVSLVKFSSLGLRGYPNPATSHLYIDNPLGITLSYRVYDLTGKQLAIYHKTGQQHSINVSSLAKGVYLLASKHGDQTGVFRFVKK